MPIIRLNAIADRVRVHDSTQPPSGLLKRVAKGSGPVIVMIHGYSYQPGHSRHCPHRQILNLAPRTQTASASSWPRGLGLGFGTADEGLGLAFGWHARGSIWAARLSAGAAGYALAQTLRQIRKRAPQRRIHILAHSMGVEVAVEALHHLPAGSLDQIISMTGACYHSRVIKALQTDAGRTVGFVNIISRENDLYDCLYERLITSPEPRDRSLSQGVEADNAVTLQLDCLDTLDHLARLGSVIASPSRRICHWSSYLRPGVMKFYSDLIRHPDIFTINRLRAGLPKRPARRWSRLCPRPVLTVPMILSHKPT